MEIHSPASESEWLSLRADDLTSTQVAALFGLSPYTTVFELYHRKINREVVDEFEGNKFTTWGNRLESAIAHGIAEDQGWKIQPMKEYIRMPERRLGASFDFSIEQGPNPDNEPWTAKGILEIKNVFGMIFNDQWVTESGNIEAPVHIELQVQTQLAVSGRPYLYIGALISGNKVHLLRREPDPEIIQAIYGKVAQFWHMVDNRIEPKPDFLKDAEFISKLYGYAEPDKVKDARGDGNILQLVSEYKEAHARYSAAEDDKTRIKSQLLMAIGDSEKCIGDTFTISAGMIAPTVIESHEKKGYRSFRITHKKIK